MDKIQAKFLLNSFRPDGADADDSVFSEALHLAAEDRDLGEWFAAERAFDAQFSQALTAVAIPATLLPAIHAAMLTDRGDVPQATEVLDAAMIGAVSMIRPPQHLRASILAAMERGTPVAAKISWLRRVSIPLAAAAGIAVAILATRPDAAAPIANSAPLRVDVVEVGFIHAYQSPFFNLDNRGENPGELFQLLGEKKLPCPQILPQGLSSLKGIGCRELIVDGKRGSLICFDDTRHGTLHLVIFKREDVSDSLPCELAPSFHQRGNWASARWCDGTHVFVLIAATETDKLAELF
jgi:hypothetical protein